MKYLLILISVLGFISSSTIDAAVINQNKLSFESWPITDPTTSSSQQNDLEEHVHDGTKSASESVLKGFEKFALITTGKQVKLYPITNDNQQSGSYFLVKIKDERFYEEISRNDAPDSMPSETISTIGNNNKTNSSSILPPTRPNGIRKKSSRSSVIPRQDSDNDFIGKIPGKDFWISDVNYVFGLDHCGFKKSDNLDQCLTLIYVDTKNQEIGYASIDLRSKSTKLQGHQSTLWADKFGVIEMSMNKRFKPPEFTQLAVDHSSRVLYTNLETKFEIRIMRQIIGGEMDFLEPINIRDHFRNLNVDANLLFYMVFDRYQLGPLPSVMKAADLRYITPPHLNDQYIAEYLSNVRAKRFGFSDYAPDSISRRVYWITEDNEFRSCNFHGRDIRVESKLPARPMIKEPGRTEIVQGAFYFSDSKRRLFYNKLAFSTAQEGHQLLLIEDHLENFRIGVPPAKYQPSPNVDITDFQDSDITEIKDSDCSPEQSSGLQGLTGRFFKDIADIKDTVIHSFTDTDHKQLEMIGIIAMLLGISVVIYNCCILCKCDIEIDESMILHKKPITYQDKHLV